MRQATGPRTVYQPSFAVVRDTFSQIKEMVQAQMRGAALRLAMELYQEEVESLCGKPFSRKGEGGHYRGGSDPSTLLIHGQRVEIRKPRVKSQGEEVELQTHRALRDYDLLCERIQRHMLSGVSTRRYDGLLEELEGGLGLKKSAVSTAFVRASQKALDDINGRDLSSYDWLAVMVDGIELAGRCVVVAMGITTEGEKIILGLREGDTEDSEVVKDLFGNLIERGMKRDIPFLFVIDGSKALRKAIRKVFGDDFPVQRCTRHKERNALKYLPQNHHPEFRRRWKLIHGMTELADARREYQRLLDWLGRINVAALDSVKEAEEETLTVIAMGAPAKLRKTLLSTNPLESAFDGVRTRTGRVKRWRKNTTQITRWAAASLLDVEKQFRKVIGYREIPVVLAAIRKNPLHQQVEVA